MANIKSKHFIGLTIETTEMKAVELSGSAAQPKICAYGGIQLPEGLFVDGVFTDTNRAAELLALLMKEKKFSKAPIILGASNQNLLLRMAEFPKLAEDKMRKAVLLQAQQYIPIPVADLELDYIDCGAGSNEVTASVLLVGAKKAFIDQMVEVIKLAGCQIYDIDGAMFAGIRAVSNAVGQSAPYMIVNVERHSSGITVIKNDTIGLARTSTNSPRFAELCFNKGALAQPEVDELAGMLQKEIVSSLQYFSIKDNSTVEKIYLICNSLYTKDVAAKISEATQFAVSAPNLYHQLSAQIDTSLYANCISLAHRGLEEA